MSVSKVLVSLLLATLVFSRPDVIPFDSAAVEQIFQNRKPALFLFASDNEASTAAREALQAYDESGTDGLILTVSDPNDGHGFFDRLTEYLGVEKDSVPRVMYMGDKNDKYMFEGEISKDSLSSFVEKVRAGEVEKFLKSSEVPENNDEPVKVVVGKTFKEMVLNSEKEVLVKFYAPWCGHCKALAPHYDEAAKKLSVNPNVMIVKMDSTLNEVDGVDIQGFPTLKFYGKDKSQPPIDYTGGRDTSGIISWIKEHTEYDWVEIPEDEPEAEKTTE